MCFSTEVSAGVAVVLLPIGGYCLAAAAVRDRTYLPLATLPLLFGVQQVFEAGVWYGVGRGDPALARPASVAFLFFALAVWPVWVPLAAAALEEPGWRRRVFVGLAAVGLAFAAAYFGPVAAGAREGPRVVGHSLRYDLPDPGLVWPVAYLAAVCLPLAASRTPAVRPLGWLALAAAGVSYVAFREAFASVWCFLAVALSVFLSHVLHRVPDPRRVGPGTEPRSPALRPARPPDGSCAGPVARVRVRRGGRRPGGGVAPSVTQGGSDDASGRERELDGGRVRDHNPGGVEQVLPGVGDAVVGEQPGEVHARQGRWLGRVLGTRLAPAAWLPALAVVRFERAAGGWRSGRRSVRHPRRPP